MGIQRLGAVLTLDELIVDEWGQYIIGVEKQNDMSRLRVLWDHL